MTSLEHQDETEDAQPEQTALGDPQVQVKEEPEEYATAQELTDVYDQLLAVQKEWKGRFYALEVRIQCGEEHLSKMLRERK